MDSRQDEYVLSKIVNMYPVIIQIPDINTMLIKSRSSARILVLSLLILMSSCENKPAPQSHESLTGTRVEVLGNLEIHQISTASFDELPLRSKLYAYQLYQACTAATAIAFDQRIQHGQELKRFVDFLSREEAITSPALAHGWKEYSKLFWACTGNYYPRNHRKFIPEIDSTAFWEEIDRYFDSSGMHLTDVFPRVSNAGIFDLSVNPILICDRGSSVDPIAGSAINLYGPSLTFEQVKEHRHHSRNGRLIRMNDQLTEELYRLGSPGGNQGRMTDVISNVITALQSAIGYAPSHAVPSINHLVDHLITGEMESFSNHLACMSRDTTDVIFRIGFFDTSQDPLGKRGIFGSLLLVKNHEVTRQLRAELETCPDREYRFAYDVLCATGCFGPICPLWISTEEGIMDQPVLLANILETLVSHEDSLDLQKAVSLLNIEGTGSNQVQNRYVFIMPKLEPVWNRMGTITDINLVYTRNFTRQMVEFSH